MLNKPGIIIFFFLFETLSVMFLAGNSLSTPVADVYPNFINFKEIASGNKKTMEFIIENKGDDTLGILGIKTSCSCLAVNAENHAIYPGNKIAIKITLDSTGKKTGATHNKVFIYTTDPMNQVIKLDVIAIVEDSLQGLEISPETISFGNITRGKGGVKQLTVTNNTNKPYRIIDISPEFGLRVDENKAGIKIPPKKKISIPVYLSTWVKPGLFSSAVTLRTTDPDNPSYKIRVTANINIR